MAKRILGKKTKPLEERDGFKFRGGHVALDFAATLAARLKPSPRELLVEPGDLARWLLAAQLTDTAPRVTPTDLRTARALRESIYSLALARSRRRALPEEARRQLNAVAAAESAAPQLGPEGLIHLAGNAAALLSSIAREAITLLGNERAQRVRQCDGEGCALFFLDTSRSGERRWCSMAGCGNKSKIAEFRRRQRLS
jgi:predicted RNA-binding Zn ribbon-like protein